MACAGPVNVGMVRQLIEVLGRGHKLKWPCGHCRTRVRRWRLPREQDINGQPRSLYSCTCTIAVHQSLVAIDRSARTGIVAMVAKLGFVAIGDAALPIPDGLRPLALLSLDPSLFGDN